MRYEKNYTFWNWITSYEKYFFYSKFTNLQNP